MWRGFAYAPTGMSWSVGAGTRAAGARLKLNDGGGRLAFGIDWVFDASDGEIAFGWDKVESVRAVRYFLYPGVQVVLKRPAYNPGTGRRFEFFTLGRGRVERILDYAGARGVTVDRRVGTAALRPVAPGRRVR